MKILKWISIASIYYLLLFMLIFIPFGTTAASEDIKEIDIITTPEKVLFDVDNMKPGDWSERVLEISNGGKEDFKYIISSKLKSGDKKLYNELKLKITSEDTKELFSGTLGQFDKLDPREIKTTDKEKLTFQVDFPAELGNEFQGLTCEVEFKIYAEGTFGGLIPAENGIKLPNTATDTMNLIVIGGALLLIGLLVLIMHRVRRANLNS
ncbi:CalY family protein [Sutcliffiella horikoshii]|uniref:LPXTG cell wall anchor domain-containing protein n=1 Tax=Sutcliffiella horikoshii TaxID=79883 RepID=UPI0007D06375|nr:LPXTG cell wall anchor domain-containing protein [Sutcliffiella horikoshii]MCM3618859.1 CalY family protein [Sutcliffiella horikoshii]